MTEEFRSRILNRLFFEEIYVRQEQIEKAHKQTFEWIFDRTGDGLRPWNNFMAWLEEGNGIYWISGKAGSGKSSLMTTIHQDKRTTKALEVWAGAASAKLLTPAFFFWNSGTELQKTSVGLLRSLLFQLISATPEITANFPGTTDGPAQYTIQKLPVWTEQ